MEKNVAYCFVVLLASFIALLLFDFYVSGSGNAIRSFNAIADVGSVNTIADVGSVNAIADVGSVNTIPDVGSVNTISDVGSLVCKIGSPTWNVRETLKDSLPDFIEVYNRRPGGDNEGGVHFFHASYLFAIVRTLRPKHIIESGAHHGVGTWFLRQACGDCQIVVVSPENPTVYRDKHPDSRYFTASAFADFNKLNWDSLIPWEERKDTLIFFDDHQSCIRRAMEARARGFRHAAFDDNYPDGDNYSFKQACDKQGLYLQESSRNKRRYFDNFGRVNRLMDATEIARHYEELQEAVEVYLEMPPLWINKWHLNRWANGCPGCVNVSLRTGRPVYELAETTQVLNAIRPPFNMNQPYMYFAYTVLKPLGESSRLSEKASCSAYDFPPADDAAIAEADQRWQKATIFVDKEHLTFIDKVARSLHKRLLQTVERDGVRGMILEAGVAKAGSSILFAALKNKGRCLHLYDTFQGMPPPSKHDGADVHQRYKTIKSGGAGANYYGYMTNLMQFDQNMFREAGLESSEQSVFWHKGLFNETMWPVGPVAFAHLDGDWYESVMVPLQRLKPWLSKGSIVIFDDVLHYSGACSAMQDFFGIKLDSLKKNPDGITTMVDSAQFTVFFDRTGQKVYARKN